MVEPEGDLVANRVDTPWQGSSSPEYDPAPTGSHGLWVQLNGWNWVARWVLDVQELRRLGRAGSAWLEAIRPDQVHHGSQFLDFRFQVSIYIE
jgi:hypothetical protein